MATGRVTYVTGKWVPEEEASMHIYDSGFMFSSGVFDMFRTFNRVPFLIDEHIERLFMSMRAFYYDIDKTAGEIKKICYEAMHLNAHLFINDEYRFMINVTRGPLAIYKDVFTLADGEQWGKNSWIVNAWPLSKTAKTLAHFYITGANAVIVAQRQIPAQFLDPKVKSRSRAHYDIANIQASKYGRDAQALLLDDDGFVCEGTGANFIIVKGGTLIVPEQRNMLRGCSMAYVLDVLAPQIGLSVVEKNIEPYDVLESSEAFFTGTFTNLIPCNRLNGQFLKGMQGRDGPMGPVTKLICDTWSNNVGIDVVGQIKEWSRT